MHAEGSVSFLESLSLYSYLWLAVSYSRDQLGYLLMQPALLRRRNILEQILDL